MTLANRLTLLRLALIPAFMGFMFVDTLWTRVAALIIFIAASLTDYYDGTLARRTGTVTVIGTFLDPLADKVLIAAALIGFVELKELHIPAWMVVLIIAREFLITGLRSLAAVRGVIMAADPAGKWKTTLQMTAIITTLVILIVNAMFVRWPMWWMAMNTPWRHAVSALLDHTPYWLMLAACIITIISGYVYIRKYRTLLKTELTARKTVAQKRATKV